MLAAGGTVHLLGSTEQLTGEVRSTLTGMGYDVHRFGGHAAAGTARKIARAITADAKVTTAFEVSADDPAAFAAAAAAAAADAVLLLTDGAQQAPPTGHWLAHHPEVTQRFAVGTDAAAADGSATPVTASGSPAVAAAVADRFFAAPPRVGVVRPSMSSTGAVTAVTLALAGGPVLLPTDRALGAATQTFLRERRTDVGRVDLVGGHLPYDDVEADVQGALLG